MKLKGKQGWQAIPCRGTGHGVGSRLMAQLVPTLGSVHWLLVQDPCAVAMAVTFPSSIHFFLTTTHLRSMKVLANSKANGRTQATQCRRTGASCSDMTPKVPGSNGEEEGGPAWLAPVQAGRLHSGPAKSASLSNPNLSVHPFIGAKSVILPLGNWKTSCPVTGTTES